MSKIYIRLWNYCVVYAIAFLSHCSSIHPSDPTGFGKWDTNCGGIAVAVNQQDWDSGLLKNHETNERYDLYLCDTSGKITKTIFTARTVDGATSSIDSIEYDINKGYIIVFSVLYGTGKVKKEKINLATLSIVESVMLDNNGNYSSFNQTSCNGKVISWDYTANWIKITQM